MRGNILDLFYLAGFTFLLAILILISSLINSSFQTQAASVMNTSIMDYSGTAINMFDFGLVFIFVCLGLASFVGAFFIDAHPIFFIVCVVLMIVTVLVGAVLSNVFNQFITTSGAIGTQANSFPLMVNLMANLPIVLFFMGLIIMIAWLSKGRKMTGGTGGY